MSHVLIRPQAERDLGEIWRFIAEDSVGAADAWIDQLFDSANRLAANPDMGRERDELLPGIRSFPVGRYVFFYQATGEGIELVRVLSGYRDLGRMEWEKG